MITEEREFPGKRKREDDAAAYADADAADAGADGRRTSSDGRARRNR